MNPSVDFSKLPLRDIHLPGSVGWWPPAPGWWALALVAIGALAYAGVLYYRRRRLRAALRAIARVSAALESGEEPVLCMQSLSTILRRFAMTVAPAPRGASVAGLAGRRWLEYLDRRWDRAAFAGDGALLAVAPYVRPRTVSRERAAALARLCSDWVKAQKPGA